MHDKRRNLLIPLLFLLLLPLLVNGCASVLVGRAGASLDKQNAKLISVPVDSLSMLQQGEILVVSTMDQRLVRGYYIKDAAENSITLSPRKKAVPGKMETIPLGDVERIQRLHTYHGFQRVGFGLGVVIDAMLITFLVFIFYWLSSDMVYT